MATVYLAHDLRHDRKVAIKVLHPKLSAVIGAERFLAEIRVTANLQHPHILPLFDSGSADGLLFYVMPLVEGESLRAKLGREKQLGVEDAVRLASQVASALDYAHRHGVVHRDIKPENVLLHDGSALVADFGIALAASHAGATRMTATGMSLGTPAYMSPEQAMGDREVDARSDIYSLGTMLYEMLVGDPPHLGSTAQAIVAKVLTEKPVPVTVHRDTVPANVAAAVQKALAKLPADRFASAADFARALATPGWSSGESLATRVMTAAASPSDPAARWRRAAMGAGALALVALAAAGWAWRRPVPPEPVVRYSMGLPAGQAMRLGIPGVNLAFSPDGRRLVYVGEGEGGDQLFVRERDRLDATPLPGTTGAYGPVFSPDGQQLAFMSGTDIELKVIPVSGGPPTTLGKPGTAGGGGLAWTPDGWIYFDSAEGYRRVRAGGGAPELVVPLDSAGGEIGLAHPDPLPGGKALLFRSRRSLNPADFDIIAYDAATRTRHVLTKGLLARYVAPGYLVFVRYDGAVLAAPFDADRLELTGAAVPVLEGVMTKAFGAVDLAVSSAGSLAYVPGETDAGRGIMELVTVSREGAIKPLDPPEALYPATRRGMALSPDGRRLVLDIMGSTGPDLWVKQLPSGPRSRLTFGTAGAIRPSWSPDGAYVVYLAAFGDSLTNGVWRQRADGSTPPERLWHVPRHTIVEASLSPDGTWLLYRVATQDADRDAFALHLGRDTTPVPLLTGPFNETGLALSPDGRWLAYSSPESGRPEIYVRPFPEVSGGRWQVSTTGGSAPRWARDGRELFFEGGNGDFMVAPVTPGATFAPGTPRRLFPTAAGAGLIGSNVVPYYDILPDGQHFIMARVNTVAPTPGGGQLVMVDHWTDELRAKLRGK